MTSGLSSKTLIDLSQDLDQDFGQDLGRSWAGFLPNSVFHRLCAGALAASEDSKFELLLQRSYAYLTFDKELVTLVQQVPRGGESGQWVVQCGS